MGLKINFVLIIAFFLIFPYNTEAFDISYKVAGSAVNLFSDRNTKTDKRVFCFGTKNKKKSNTINIKEAVAYNAAIGYGFDFKTSDNVTLKTNTFTADKPTYFSVLLPEGSYTVTVTFGSKEKSTNTTIKAESRRLMLDQKVLAKGEFGAKTFVVDMHTARIDDKKNIQLKDRDSGQLNWDNKLTLEFLGEVEISSVVIESAANVKTIYLAGDSTVTDQDLEPWASWGQFITNYFDENVVVANYAFSGATLRSFKGSGRLQKVMSLIKPGDYFVIEFAHNDEKEKGEGIGPWLSYSASLREFVQVARDKGAFPVLVTPVQRRAFNPDGTLKPTHGDFPDAMRKVAQEMKVPLVDITNLTTTLYESWGDQSSRKGFVQYPANTFPGQKEKLEDNTHFNSFGANEIALCVIKGLRDINSPLTTHLLKDVPDYDPRYPNKFENWTLPMSNRFEIIKPDGN